VRGSIGARAAKGNKPDLREETARPTLEKQDDTKASRGEEVLISWGLRYTLDIMLHSVTISRCKNDFHGYSN
jgi:hypothetical protein